MQLLNYEDVVYLKVNAVKEVYRKWGLILRSTLRQMSPKDLGILRNSIQFRVIAPRSKKDITSKVQLIVGIIDPRSPALDYLRFILYGKSLGFTPKDKIINYLKRKGAIYYGVHGRSSRSEWRWTKSGQIFRGSLTHNKANNFFLRVYNMYNKKIDNEVKKIIKE